MNPSYPRLAILMVMLFWTASPARAVGSSLPGTGAITVVRVNGGLRIGLTFRKMNYFRNELVPVTVSVDNVSSRPIQLRQSCGYGYMWVDVLNAAGSLVYPPAVRAEPDPACDGESTLALRPGQSRKRHLVVLLRSAWLRPVVSTSRRLVSGVMTQFNLVKGGQAPTIVVSAKNHDGVQTASITPPHPEVGPMYYVALSQCYLGIANVDTPYPLFRTGWARTQTLEIQSPPCISDVYGDSRFTVAGGWLGQPAGSGHGPG